MNSMLKLNLGALFTPANTAPLAILYANGPLSLPAFTHATAPAYNGTTDELTLDLEWSGTPIGQDAPTDVLNLALINVTTGLVQEVKESGERVDGASNVVLTNINGTDAYTVVAFFKNEDGTKNGIGYPIASVIAGTAAGYAGGNNSNMPF